MGGGAVIVTIVETGSRSKLVTVIDKLPIFRTTFLGIVAIMRVVVFADGVMVLVMPLPTATTRGVRTPKAAPLITTSTSPKPDGIGLGVTV